jgi:hypothetical protein
LHDDTVRVIRSAATSAAVNGIIDRRMAQHAIPACQYRAIFFAFVVHFGQTGNRQENVYGEITRNKTTQ